MPGRTGRLDTTFRHAFGIRLTSADDWFDPQLHSDTDLFIDPFLMFDETRAPWNVVHDRIIDFFNTAMEHVADSGGNRQSVKWRRAAAMFSFPEPPEFCLGYGRQNIFGAGTSGTMGQEMLNAARAAIDAGLRNINEFGELLLFGEGFGADRISDMVCNIVKDDFVRYTKKVVARHSLPTESFRLRHQGFDFARDRWVDHRPVELPPNPCWAPRTPVLLVPSRFLSELPKMDDQEFWDWVYTHRNEQLRQDLGYHVTRNLKKKEILTLARRRATLRRKYGIEYEHANRRKPPQPYDLKRDPSFKVTALRSGQDVADLLQLTPPTGPVEFCTFVRELVDDFRWAVEDRGIWKSFWSGSLKRAEPQVQDLFHIAVLHTCKKYDIDVTPEANSGPGPVDFKFSSGWKKKALVEMKFASSSHFWDNLEEQVPAYLRAEGTKCGFILVIQHTEADRTPEFVERAKRLVKRIAKETRVRYEPVFVDARQKPSASKLKGRSKK
jgi:hypothetical protein